MIGFYQTLQVVGVTSFSLAMFSIAALVCSGYPTSAVGYMSKSLRLSGFSPTTQRLRALSHWENSLISSKISSTGMAMCSSPSSASSNGTTTTSSEKPKLSDSKKDAYITALNGVIPMPCIILVNPFLDQNIGSCARTMLNFGLTELRIVDPMCDHLSEPARALAAGASEILENAKIYQTLESCVADLNRIMATTIRPRDMTQLIYSPQKAAEIAVTGDKDIKVGIMFGRERNGLSNEEIAVADSIITIASFKSFSSLNLAQAVNIVSYEMHNRALNLLDEAPQETRIQPREGGKLASRAALEFFFRRLEDSLDKVNYQPHARRKELAYMNIRNIFQRTTMTKSEVDTLQGVLSALMNPVYQSASLDKESKDPSLPNENL